MKALYPFVLCRASFLLQQFNDSMMSRIFMISNEEKENVGQIMTMYDDDHDSGGDSDEN